MADILNSDLKRRKSITNEGSVNKWFFHRWKGREKLCIIAICVQGFRLQKASLSCQKHKKARIIVYLINFVRSILSSLCPSVCTKAAPTARMSSCAATTLAPIRQCLCVLGQQRFVHVKWNRTSLFLWRAITSWVLHLAMQIVHYGQAHEKQCINILRVPFLHRHNDSSPCKNPNKGLLIL